MIPLLFANMLEHIKYIFFNIKLTIKKYSFGIFIIIANNSRIVKHITIYFQDTPKN